jgi:hypothetical protein
MWRVSLLVAIVLMPSALVGRQESAEVQLKAAMHRELVDGDLRAAIKSTKRSGR